MEIQKQLPENCMACPNHGSVPSPIMGTKTRSSSHEDIGCTLNRCLIAAEQPKKSPSVPRPEWCPLQEEEQPWQAASMIRGVTIIKIDGVGEFGSNQPMLLIERAVHVHTVLTGKCFSGRAENFLELVSADPASRTATFRLK